MRSLICVASIVAGALYFAGCSTTPADLEAKAPPITQSFSENYQEIYRRVATNARRCLSTSLNATATMTVDADLYPDLGYGEITFSLINMGVRNYYVSARVEREKTGARLIVRSGNSLGAERWKAMFFDWANDRPVDC